MQSGDINWTHWARVWPELLKNGAHALWRRKICRRRRFVGVVAAVACVRNCSAGSERHLGRIHVRDNDKQRNKQVGRGSFIEPFSVRPFSQNVYIMRTFSDTITTWDSFP